MRRVLGGLALGIVEIRRHRDDRAENLVVKAVFRPVAQRRQDLGTDFDRAFFAGHGLQRDHAGLVDQLVGQLRAVDDIVDATAHQALDRRDGVLWILHLRGQGVETDLAAGDAVVVHQVTYHAGQQHAALRIGQALGHAAAHAGYQRMGGAQVNADGDAPLVRIGSLPGFGNLQ